MKENKLAVALAVREAMRGHRRGKPVAFPTYRPPSTAASRSHACLPSQSTLVAGSALAKVRK
jgi:hypothetical protein